MFCDTGPRFGGKLILHPTQPQNKQNEPSTLEYYRAHRFISLFSFYVKSCLHFILQISPRAANLLAIKTNLFFFIYVLWFKIKMTVK